MVCGFFCVKQKTAYELRISDWSSDVCSSYLTVALSPSFEVGSRGSSILYDAPGINAEWTHILSPSRTLRLEGTYRDFRYRSVAYDRQDGPQADISRSEAHTSELQSLTRNSHAVFCLKQTIKTPTVAKTILNSKLHLPPIQF